MTSRWRLITDTDVREGRLCDACGAPATWVNADDHIGYGARAFYGWACDSCHAKPEPKTLEEQLRDSLDARAWARGRIAQLEQLLEDANARATEAAEQVRRQIAEQLEGVAAEHRAPGGFAADRFIAEVLEEQADRIRGKSRP